LRQISLSGKALLQVYSEGVSIPESFSWDVLGTLERLEQVFGRLDRPLLFKIGGGSSSLTISYNPTEDAVVFPGGGNIRNYGLEDRDRLHHEMFHAVVARKRPDRVTPEALKAPGTLALHEGAADFFAWLLDDNEIFGEKYFLGPTVLRKYRSTLLYPLARGGHARGNALTGYLIRSHIPLRDVANFFLGDRFEISYLVRSEDHAAFGLDPRFRPETMVSFLDLPLSRKGRYRVREGDLLSVAINPALAELAPDLEVQFRSAKGEVLKVFEFQTLERNPDLIRFQVHPRSPRGAEKVILRYLQGGKILGFDVLYLSVAREG
jgi:hypothetical protein